MEKTLGVLMEFLLFHSCISNCSIQMPFVSIRYFQVVCFRSRWVSHILEGQEIMSSLLDFSACQILCGIVSRDLLFHFYLKGRHNIEDIPK